MYHKVLELLVTLIFLCSCSDSIGIDDKLDFGPTKTHPSFRSYDSRQRSSYDLPVKHRNIVTVKENSDHFDNPGVVCAPEGCNKTQSTKNSEDTVKTDVVVHIETKVDLNHNKSMPVGDTPDIPVVIGYSGSSLDRSNDDKSSPNPQSIFIPSLKPLQPQYPSQLGIPVYGQSYQPSGYSQNEAPHNTLSGVPNYGQVYSLNPPQSYYSAQDPASNRRTDSGSYRYDFQGDSYFNPDRQVNINIEALPPVAVGIAGISQSNMLDDNGIQLTVPYFDPSHHNHHFGEHPPPQIIYSTRKPGSFNPVEFKTTKSTWTPSAWFREAAPHRHTNTPVGENVKCFCQNGHLQPGLRWYPSVNRRISTGGLEQELVKSSDPGSQINDKLAPLN